MVSPQTNDLGTAIWKCDPEVTHLKAWNVPMRLAWMCPRLRAAAPWAKPGETRVRPVLPSIPVSGAFVKVYSLSSFVLLR